MNQIKKIKRIGNVISILSKYGFDDLIARTSAEKFLPRGFVRSRRGEELFKLSVYERVRLVLEELGPTYVKLGQMFSNREDILPPEMIAQLAELQDNVPPEELDIYQKLSDELLINPKEHFEYVNPTPIASASISGVYGTVDKWRKSCGEGEKIWHRTNYSIRYNDHERFGLYFRKEL